VLEQPLFACYFAGSFASNLGTWLQNTAQMLLAYQLTHSALAVGEVTCAQFIGFVVIGPWAGTIADRIGPKFVLVGTQVMSACVAAAMAYLKLTGTMTEHDLVLGALATGLAFTFSLPLQTALVPRLVSPGGDMTSQTASQTKAAMAMNSVSYNAGRTLAPVLAVVVLVNIGTAWAFALNAISFLIFAAVIVGVHPAGASGVADARPGWNALRLAAQHPRLILLLVMVASVTFADDPVLVLGPSLAHKILGVSRIWPAFFLSALGLGTVLGALFPVRPPNSRRAAIPLAVLAISVIIFTAGISVLVSLVAALSAGVAALLAGSSLQAMLLRLVAPAQATQVMALWAVAWAGSKPFASLADGWLATSFGILPAGLLLAAPALAVAAAELWLPKMFRERTKYFARSYQRNHAADSMSGQREPAQLLKSNNSVAQHLPIVSHLRRLTGCSAKRIEWSFAAKLHNSGLLRRLHAR
jgi:MFS family permease